MAKAADAPTTPLSHTVFQFFFASHIPATILLDSQARFPSMLKMYPAAVVQTAKWYCETFGDPLMSNMPVWFKALVGLEVAFELPFFFAALYALRTRKNWIRIPAIIYASHTVTALVPILASLISDAPADKRAVHVLLSFYTPYILIPAWIGVHFVCNPG
ncbi:transmembrane protein 6/97 [Baffinella frigidus]|nr:transmembrane protein 6/97 [Cryptophyta sp. CCMP2293]